MSCAAALGSVSIDSKASIQSLDMNGRDEYIQTRTEVYPVKSKRQEIMKSVMRALAALAFIASPASLGAQGCAMCNQNAAASGPRTIHAINTGILILMFPPAVITLGIFYLAYKKRNTFNEAA